jgi:hypothetical protein
MVMMMVSLVMVPRGCEGRDGKDHQQQDGGKNLLHGTNVARAPRRWKKAARSASKQEPVHGRLQETRTGVN